MQFSGALPNAFSESQTKMPVSEGRAKGGSDQSPVFEDPTQENEAKGDDVNNHNDQLISDFAEPTLV